MEMLVLLLMLSCQGNQMHGCGRLVDMLNCCYTDVEKCCC